MTTGMALKDRGLIESGRFGICVSTDSQVQTTRTRSKLSASICASGEYLELPASLPKLGQSVSAAVATAAMSSGAAQQERSRVLATFTA